MEEQNRPTFVEIDLGAILNNYHRFREQIGPDVSVMGVVKADAYGHGAVPVAHTLVGAGAEWLGVARLEEAVELRLAGIQAPILLLGGAEPEEAEAVREFGIQCAVYDEDLIEKLDHEGRKWGHQVHVHLKVDTGMHRLGVSPEHIEKVTRKILACEGLSLDGIMSHLASADEPDSGLTRSQLESFALSVSQVESLAGRRLFRHLANSAAAVMIPDTRYDLVRPGIMLYGSHMTELTKKSLELEPAFTWKARIRQIKQIPDGEIVGYGATWRANRESRAGIISVGYADGFTRSLGNQAEVIVRGSRVPVIGRVSMDLITVDLTEMPEARPGDYAVLLGSDSGASIPVEEWTRRLGTISYEVFTNVSRRVPRIHKGMARP